MYESCQAVYSLSSIWRRRKKNGFFIFFFIFMAIVDEVTVCRPMTENVSVNMFNDNYFVLIFCIAIRLVSAMILYSICWKCLFSCCIMSVHGCMRM